jgi:hypothetical protein
MMPKDQTDHKIQSLSDLVGFDVPRITMTFPTPNELVYVLGDTADNLARFRNAVDNAIELLSDGSESILDLLFSIELCECEHNLPNGARINALALLSELLKILRIVQEMAWKLERTKPTESEATT